MTAESFCYWLQGFFELSGDEGISLTREQAKAIRNHLNLVFLHDIDPKAGGKDVQAKLNAAHHKSFVDGGIARC